MFRIAPHRYQSARGCLQKLGESLESLGERALVIANNASLERFEDVIRSSLKESMIGVSFEVCLGQCCLPEIERLVDEAEKEDADMIVGIGASRTLDVSKYSAQKLDFPMVAIPSVASSYAAFTNLVHLYNEDGDFLEVQPLDVCPDLTIVDYKIVGLAPSRHLRAGMGSALAVTYEFDISHEELQEHYPSQIAYNLARHLRSSMFDRGAKALEDVRRGEVTGRVESVIEMNVLQAGLISSLGGVTFRSIIANHLAVHLAPYTGEDVLLGEVVAFGLLAQELLRGTQPEELTDLLDFFGDVGLPMTMDALELPENQRGAILKDAAQAIEEHLKGWNLSFEVGRENLVEALNEADRTGQLVTQSGLEAIG